MYLSRRTLVGGLAVMLTACGHIPDATVTYYLATTKVSLRVVRTVSCDQANRLVAVATVTPLVEHSADLSAAQTVSLSTLRATFADTDVGFDLFEDGRLRSVNATQEGRAQAIIESASTLIAGVLRTFAVRPMTTPPPADACSVIRPIGKPVTITYESRIDVSATGAQAIQADAATSYWAELVKPEIGDVRAVVTSKGTPAADPVAPTGGSPGTLLLKARQPGWIDVELRTAINGSVGAIFWRGQLPVAQFGRTYQIPVPKPAAFGKQVFVATFADSGALTRIQYVGNAGAAQGLNAANAALGALREPTAEQQLKQVKAEADLIAQQHRLAQCLATPQDCKP